MIPPQSKGGFSVPGAVETATVLLEVSNALIELGRQGKQEQNRHVREITRVLRSLYFTPKGTMRILQSLADGAIPNTQDVEAILTDFNDREWAITRNLQTIEPDDFFKGVDVSLRQGRTLMEIAHNKRSLRRDLQDELNGPLTKGQPLDQDRARALLNRVKDLNTAIESLEEEFL
jgi:hypothetical protein